MPIFLTIVFILLIAIFRKKPKESRRVVKPTRKPVPIRTAPKVTVAKHQTAKSIATKSKESFKPSSPAKPNDMSVELANKHFGWEWQEFLSARKAEVTLTKNQIVTIAGWAYQKLDETELKDLLNSFVKTETNNGVTVRRPFVCTELHQAAYDLMNAGRFESVPFKLALKKIIANYRIEVLSKTNDGSIITNVEEKLTETSVIDVAPIDYPITPNENFESDAYRYAEYNPDDYKLGKIYKDTLKLSAQEAAWLNKFPFYENGFNATEGCKIALMRLYLQVIKKVVRRFANEPSTLTMHLDDIKTAAYETSKKDRDIWYGYNHNQAKDAVEADLYYVVFKKCEAALRVAWRVGRSSAPSFHSRSEKAIAIFKQNIEPVLDEVIKEQTALVPTPDDNTNLVLNAQSTTRWKADFEEIMQQTNLSVGELKDCVYKLSRLNMNNPAIENLFYDAAKVFARLDKSEALCFYIHYIEADQRSVRIDNKDFQKTTLKQLFTNDEQEQDFRAIITEFIESKDLKTAIEKAAGFYQAKRKKITLDNSAIARAADQLNDTVEILNQYLADDEEVMTIAAPVLVEKTYTKQIVLNVVQQELLDMFDAVGLQLSKTNVAEFAKTKGVFKNQLIDSINDSCYEVIDDVLIEEDDDTYTILPDYYKQLFN